MEIKTGSSRMYSLVALHDMHTKFFSGVIAGISDEDAHNRMNTKANHIAWLAGSLVQERYELAKASGGDAAHLNLPVTNELFKHHKGIQDDVTYPALAELKKDWDNISPVLRDTLVNMSDAQLDRRIEMPGEQMTVFNLVTFKHYREASCIGQISLWRKLLGYEAMRYM